MVTLRWPPGREPVDDFGRHAPAAASASVSSTAAPRAGLLPFGYSLPRALTLMPNTPRPSPDPAALSTLKISVSITHFRPFRKLFRTRRAGRGRRAGGGPRRLG